VEVVDWIHLAEHRDQSWALVNMVMNIWGPLKEGNLLNS
jgi:hypothetical protein